MNGARGQNARVIEVGEDKDPLVAVLKSDLVAILDWAERWSGLPKAQLPADSFERLSMVAGKEVS